MAKIIVYRCDRCGKETYYEKEMERYRNFEIERGYPDSSSYSKCDCISSIDLCEDCNKIFRENIKNFFNTLREEFKVK